MCKTKAVFSITLKQKSVFLFILFVFLSFQIFSQQGGFKWSSDGNSYYRIENNNWMQYTLPENIAKVLMSKEQLTPKNSTLPLDVSYFIFSNDEQKVLIFTNTKRVWRLNTKGDYWVWILLKVL